MPEIKIKGTSQQLIDKIDVLVGQSEYPNRSAFLVAVLEDYCLYHDRYFLHCLPDTIRILAEDTLNKGKKEQNDLLRYTLKSVNVVNNFLKQLMQILSSDNEELPEEKDDDS